MSRVVDLAAIAFVRRLVALWFAAAGLLLTGAPARAADPPGLGDPGSLVRIAIETADAAALRGPEARLQLVVTGHYSSGQQLDLTSQAIYAAVPSAVVNVSTSGQVSPLAEGSALIQASVGENHSASITVETVGFDRDEEVDFVHQIMPIFTRFGCNAGGCHGKAGGQNGFALSLLGFYPRDDYDALVKEARGRRLMPAAPDQSLLLTKAINRTPHGGGQRLAPDSAEYRLLRRWIAQGAPADFSDRRRPVALQMTPTARRLPLSGAQQLQVCVRYSDGALVDVTHLCQFHVNEPKLAEVSQTGLVRTLGLPGTAAVMARYAGLVAVFRAQVPLGFSIASTPRPRNFIDEHLFRQLQEMGVPPSELCSDEVFLRRVSLDIAGRLPTLAEAREFLHDESPQKRTLLIDRLLASGAYADHFTNKWNAILRNKRERYWTTSGDYELHRWIRNGLYRNKPYDQFVRELLTATGDLDRNPPVAWYRWFSMDRQHTYQWTEDAAQLFLGQQIKCARCHHHPFENWSEEDYHGLAAFFAKVDEKYPPGLRGNMSLRIVHDETRPDHQHPRTRVVVAPTVLGGQPIKLRPDQDPRQKLADWVCSPENPYFARALVNRYWKHFFSRGLVDPEDNMIASNPASNERLLAALAKHFVEHRFDLKSLIRTICGSAAYQLRSEPNSWNQSDTHNFASYYPKRLDAEVLYDAFGQATGVAPQFDWMPKQTTAVQLPDDLSGHRDILAVFGAPRGESACECERSNDGSIRQSLYLLNSNEIQQMLASDQGRAARWANDPRPTAELIAELFLTAVARYPTAEETAAAEDYLAPDPRDRQRWENLLWALMNSREFLFNH